MRAVVCREFGPPGNLAVEDVAEPDPGPGEVRIAIKACGVNYADLLMIAGRYQVKPPLPFSPGFEFAGDVIDVAADVSAIEPGQRVIATTFFGGMAEHICVPADAVSPLPEDVDYITAAAFPIAYGTAYHALEQRAALRSGETLVVLGAAGGVGLAAVEIGKMMGATVIAAASSENKLELASKYGADHLINYAAASLKDEIREMTAGRGADVIYDPVGGELFEQCLRAASWGGRMLVIGFASGRIPSVPANLPLLKGLSIVGVYYGRFIEEQPEASRRNFEQLLAWLKVGQLKPHVSETYPLDQSAAALDVLASRRARGRIVIVI